MTEDIAEAAKIAALREKMRPHLRSDDEARLMLRALEMNPAVQAFCRSYLQSKDR